MAQYVGLIDTVGDWLSWGKDPGTAVFTLLQVNVAESDRGRRMKQYQKKRRVGDGNIINSKLTASGNKVTDHCMVAINDFNICRHIL